MSGQRRPDLTDGQIICLELVNQLHTSKQIARKLGISPFTVDQRLDAARKKLGASSRVEAAQKFAEMQRQGISQPLVYDPAELDTAVQPSHSKGEDTATAAAGDGTDESQTGLGSDGRIPIKSRLLFWKLLPPIGGPRHKLSAKDVLLQSMNVAFYCSLMIAMIIVITAGTMRLMG